MKTVKRIKILCEKHLTPAEIDQVIQQLRTLKHKKTSAARRQKSSTEIPIRPGWEVIEEKRSDYVTYRRERVRCGEEKFKCNMGLLDGPFWYGYYRRDNRLISKYIGRNFRPISPIAGHVDVKRG
jgi:hypothetical protein